MGQKYFLSERDYRRIQEMMIWFEKVRRRPLVPRRRAAGGGGGQTTEYGIILRGLKYASPSGKPPEGFKDYIVVLKTANGGPWNSNTEYSAGQQCWISRTINDVTTTKIYRALQANKGTSPPAECWQEVPPISPKGLCLDADGYGVPVDDLRNTLRWYYPKDEVPLVKKDDVYYFDDPVIPVVNKDGEGSLGWIDSEQRPGAVFK